MSVEQLSLEVIIQRGEALLSSDLGDEVVMMDIEKGSYYGLQTVAARIWRLTEKPVSIGSLCDQLTVEYQVSAEQCRKEVVAFLGELMERRIIHIVSPANV